MWYLISADSCCCAGCCVGWQAFRCSCQWSKRFRPPTPVGTPRTTLEMETTLSSCYVLSESPRAVVTTPTGRRDTCSTCCCRAHQSGSSNYELFLGSYCLSPQGRNHKRALLWQLWLPPWRWKQHCMLSKPETQFITVDVTVLDLILCADKRNFARSLIH